MAVATLDEDRADPFHSHVEVDEGIMECQGFRSGPSVQRAVRVLAEKVPGAEGVRDRTEVMLTSGQAML
ncbi:hypothetical protein AAFN86_24050 [Roseomonas sp. CAU 1739]|uniref:hypothetical protein n=1 Tax=Roseomonas sp. CAU 1739 TaxID=3140364 RepID=UPI00325BA384